MTKEGDPQTVPQNGACAISDIHRNSRWPGDQDGACVSVAVAYGICQPRINHPNACCSVSTVPRSRDTELFKTLHGTKRE
jgi:hypothetical protein